MGWGVGVAGRPRVESPAFETTTFKARDECGRDVLYLFRPVTGHVWEAEQQTWGLPSPSEPGSGLPGWPLSEGGAAGARTLSARTGGGVRPQEPPEGRAHRPGTEAPHGRPPLCRASAPEWWPLAYCRRGRRVPLCP